MRLIFTRVSVPTEASPVAVPEPVLPSPVMPERLMVTVPVAPL